MVSEAKTYVSDGKAFQMSCVLFYQNWEEKSLRHLAMVAKFLDDRNRKRHLKSEFALFQTSSILFSSY